MEIGAYDAAGIEVAFQVRTVPLDDGRLGCVATPDLMRLVERDPRVRLEAGRTGTAQVLRSGRTLAEVHGRLRRARPLPTRASSGPVLLIRPE